MLKLRVKEVNDKYGRRFIIQKYKWRKPLFKKGFYEWDDYDVEDYVRINGVSTMFGKFGTKEAAMDYINEIILKKKTVTYHEV